MKSIVFMTSGVLICTVLLNLLASWRGLCFFRSSKRELLRLKDCPPVTLIIPVCGLEKDGGLHFKRFLDLDWPVYQVIFTVMDPRDPALSVLKELKSGSPHEVILNVGGEAKGNNLKIRNLSNGFKHAKHDWLLICDADVIPDRDLIRSMMHPFFSDQEEKFEVGLVHALYRCSEENSFASAWEGIWINCDFWVQGLLGDWMKGTDFGFGAVMMFRRETLEKVGGYGALSDYLADDYQLGNRIFKYGKKIEFAPRWVSMLEAEGGMVQSWRHLLRWSRTIRICQPGGYAGSLILNMTLWALVALCLNPQIFLPWSMGVLGLRILLGWQCHRWAVGGPFFWKWFWLIPLKDLLQVILWLLAFKNGTLEWRGVRYSLTPDGKLLPL